MSKSTPSKRRGVDIMKLTAGGFEVTVPDPASPYDFNVKFSGPDETPYAGGLWTVHVTLPANYPFQSPSIGFGNRMFHPNVDERSGSVCLDVINQTWSPMFDLLNVFETFLPQLLRYPNPSDPLNGEAANLLLRDPVAYSKRIQDCVIKYASPSPTAVAKEEPEPDLRKDSTTTAESIISVRLPGDAALSEPLATGDGGGYMSDASELSDL